MTIKPYHYRYSIPDLLSPSVPTVQPQPQTKPPPVTSTVITSTSTASTVTPATKAVTTVPFGATTPAKVFTPYPSTTKLIATATRPHSTTTHSTTTGKNQIGGICEHILFIDSAKLVFKMVHSTIKRDRLPRMSVDNKYIFGNRKRNVV